ncbi:MAG: TonB-dependent receptor [Dysgonamonadaceae bacterium]|jgi:TonB-linked SusC/RagA family outer membrane protein|nr:TonB-dependent receptor [Dysgonamonadaceae bacterium]
MKLKKVQFIELIKRRVSLLLLLLVIAPCFAYSQQSSFITGVVSDASGDPLTGVSVVIKQSTVGTVTDIDGKYSIQARPDAVLVFSYIGYSGQEITVGDRTIIDVTLKENDALLDEVVVVGYGVQKKVNLTGSVTAVSSKKIESRATPNLSTTLAGLASGVSVRQNSGNPGDDGANIRVRGIGTFSGDYRSPMVIIDGAEADINSVNPEDVESISVLKDAGSAAIYGSRAANGVLLITTKKGAKNVKPKVTYTGLITQEKASTSFELLSDYADYMELWNRAQRVSNPTATLIYDQTDIDAWRAAKTDPNGIYTDPDTGNQIPNYLAYPNTNWSDILFAPSYAQKHNVSVQGGGSNNNYLLSLGYFTNPGTLENTGVDRFNMRVNVESSITDFLKIGTQTYAMQQNKDPGDLSQVNTYRMQTVGGINPYVDGKYGGPENLKEKSDVRNPIKDINLMGGVYTTTRINTTWYADVDIWQGLTARASINYQDYFYDGKTYSKQIDGYSFRSGKIIVPGTTLADATTTRTANRRDQYTATATMNYSRTFAEHHSVSALLGYEQFYYNRRDFDATKKGLLNFSVTDITTATDMQSITDNPNRNKQERDYGMISFFGRVNYAYQGKYLAEANFRRDASSRFSPDNRWGTFPSFSAGWRISEEAFAESLKPLVSDLKLRLSWGRLGNTTSGYYDWQATYAKSKYAFNNSSFDGLAVSKIANAFLQWESITSKGIGLDALFLNQRLSLEADFYNKLTEGILTSPSIYLTMGMAGAPTRNTSDMQNRGVEITLGWRDKIGNVNYSISGNFAYNQNKVVKYLGKLEQGWTTDENGNRIFETNIGEVANHDSNSETGTLRVEGHLFDEYYLRTHYRGTGSYYNTDGSVDPNGGPADGMIRSAEDLKWVQDMQTAGYSFNGSKTTARSGGLWYGEYIMADLNGDGNYGNSYDRQFTGKSSAPKYNYGLTLAAEWKGFDLSMTWAGAAGFSYYLHERGVNRNYLTTQTDALPADATSKFYYVAWDANGDPDWSNPLNNLTAEYARLRNGSAGAYVENDQFLYDASYLKLKTLQIGYTLPQKWTSKAKMNDLRIFVSGENLLTVTNYPGLDPELGSGVALYPIARLLSAGINLSF